MIVSACSSRLITYKQALIWIRLSNYHNFTCPTDTLVKFKYSCNSIPNNQTILDMHSDRYIPMAKDRAAVKGASCASI